MFTKCFQIGVVCFPSYCPLPYKSPVLCSSRVELGAHVPCTFGASGLAFVTGPFAPFSPPHPPVRAPGWTVLEGCLLFPGAGCSQGLNRCHLWSQHLGTQWEGRPILDAPWGELAAACEPERSSRRPVSAALEPEGNSKLTPPSTGAR